MNWTLRREVLQEFYEAAQQGLRPGVLRWDEALYLRIFNHDEELEKSRTEQAAYRARLAKDPAALARRREARRVAARQAYERLHGSRAAREANIKSSLVALLAEHRGNVSAVARAMGKARAQVHRWMERFGVERPLTLV